ncbi:MAG: hypothetical protein NTW48_08580 [Chloroflexi bacterium]|nr:hypothetical protein [Chloroflexota bacterium]
MEATGVDIIVTNCLPCVLQLRGGLDKRQSHITMMHSANRCNSQIQSFPVAT